MEKIQKEYTVNDLKKNNKLYEKNFALMIKAVGTPEHIIYATIEKELNKKEAEIRRNFKPAYPLL